MYQILIRLFSFLLIITKVIFKSKDDLLLENLALRQQLSTYLKKKPKPKLSDLDRCGEGWLSFGQRDFLKWQNSLNANTNQLLNQKQM